MQEKYNSYMSVQMVEIGKYAAKNSSTNVAKHFLKMEFQHK